jgi:hypothetical protein
MSKIASSLQTDVKVDLQPCGESTAANLSYLSASGCRLTMVIKLSENITIASLRDADFWLRLAKAQLCVNAEYMVKDRSNAIIYGLPYTDKCELSKLATMSLSDDISKLYPDAKLHKAVVKNFIKAVAV